MATLRVLLCILLMASYSLSEKEASEPNCTGVEDFKACLGNTDNFCPDTIECQCKDEKPFCRCEYFRVDWKEYWYMGPKCNHLWNTLDFILVATLPAVGLLIIAVAIFCCVYHCQSEKARNQTIPPSHGAQHNPAFTAEMPGNFGNTYQPGRAGSDWVGQIPKAVIRRQDLDDVSATSQLQNYSPSNPLPFRRPESAADYFPSQQPPYEKPDYPSSDLPYGGYAEGRQSQKY